MPLTERRLHAVEAALQDGIARRHLQALLVRSHGLLQPAEAVQRGALAREALAERGIGLDGLCDWLSATGTGSTAAQCLAGQREHNGQQAIFGTHLVAILQRAVPVLERGIAGAAVRVEDVALRGVGHARMRSTLLGSA